MLLGLTDKERGQILSINQANHPGRFYRAPFGRALSGAARFLSSDRGDTTSLLPYGVPPGRNAALGPAASEKKRGGAVLRLGAFRS